MSDYKSEDYDIEEYESEEYEIEDYESSYPFEIDSLNIDDHVSHLIKFLRYNPKETLHLIENAGGIKKDIEIDFHDLIDSYITNNYNKQDIINILYQE